MPLTCTADYFNNELQQYAIQQQQQLNQQMYAAVRHSTPSPHAQNFGAIDYGSQLPMMMPGSAVFGTPSGANQGMSLYQQSLGHARKLNGEGSPGMTLRSALLDEFRANKSRKWELKVRSRDLSPACIFRY